MNRTITVLYKQSIVVLAFTVSIFVDSNGVASEQSVDKIDTYEAAILCGPISVCMAAHRLNVKCNVQEIANRVNMTAAGTSMPELASVVQEIGLDAEFYRLQSAKPLAQLTNGTSAIVLLRGDHFALVWPAKDGKLWLAEYPNPTRMISHLELAENWDPRVLVVKYADSPQVFPDKRLYPAISLVIFAAILIIKPRLIQLKFR